MNKIKRVSDFEKAIDLLNMAVAYHNAVANVWALCDAELISSEDALAYSRATRPLGEYYRELASVMM